MRAIVARKRPAGTGCRIVGAATALLLGLAPEVKADGGAYEAGQRAFESGKLARAAAIWRPLARAGGVRAQHALGVLHERGGGGMAADPERAADWYRRAARRGHRDAQTNLGRLYATGRGVPEQPDTAAELWQRAARHGQAVAQYNLALAHHQGRGVDADPRRAAHWLRKAARQGLAPAQHALARMYRLGRTLPRDPSLALAWYGRAADAGHAGAKRRAEALRERGVRAAEIADDVTAPSGPGSHAAPRQRYAVWLGSAGSRDAARGRWTALRTRHPAVIAPLPLRLRTVADAAGEPVTRVLAGAFPRRDVASDVCADLRARHANAFCQVRAARP